MGSGVLTPATLLRVDVAADETGGWYGAEKTSTPGSRACSASLHHEPIRVNGMLHLSANNHIWIDLSHHTGKATIGTNMRRSQNVLSSATQHAAMRHP